MAGNIPGPLIDFLISSHYIDYKRMFKVKEQSDHVKDELAEKIEELTNIPVIRDRKLEKKEPAVFENPSTVSEDTISDVIDAFVGMRNGSTLEQINGNSLNKMLIMLNEKINIDFDKKLQDQLSTFGTEGFAEESPMPSSRFREFNYAPSSSIGILRTIPNYSSLHNTYNP